MGTVLQIGGACLICTLLAYLSHRRGFTVGFLDGLGVGRTENQQLEYHRGYVDGAAETRAKMNTELETRIRKQYERGFNDALAAVKGETYAALLDEAETHLSA